MTHFYTPRPRRNYHFNKAVEEFTQKGWKVYARGFPTLVVEKGTFLRMIVVNPLTLYGDHIELSQEKQQLSDAFYKCFGVQYEVWENNEEPTKKRGLDEDDGGQWL